MRRAANAVQLDAAPAFGQGEVLGEGRDRADGMELPRVRVG